MRQTKVNQIITIGFFTIFVWAIIENKYQAELLSFIGILVFGYYPKIKRFEPAVKISLTIGITLAVALCFFTFISQH